MRPQKQKNSEVTFLLVLYFLGFFFFFLVFLTCFRFLELYWVFLAGGWEGQLSFYLFYFCFLVFRCDIVVVRRALVLKIAVSFGKLLAFSCFHIVKTTPVNHHKPHTATFLWNHLC